MFIDLFAGCGGFSLGLGKSGLRGLFAIEKDYQAFDTLQSNLISGKHRCYDWPDWLNQSAHNIDSILDNHRDDIANLSGRVSLIVGGPPCQGFSLAGRRNPSDPRNQLTERYLEFVRLVQPRYVVIENVRGFNAAFKNKNTALGKTPYSEVVKEKLSTLGYAVHSQYVDCSKFGVPQKRTRFLIIGVHENDRANKDLDPFSILEEMRIALLKKNGLPDRPITIKEAIGDLEIIRNGTEPHDYSGKSNFKKVSYKPPRKLNQYVEYSRAGLNGSAPNSLRLARHKDSTIAKFESIGRLSKPGLTPSKEVKERLGIKKQVVCVLDPNVPSKTITTLPDDLIHYSEPRILTVRESARVQSFPDSFVFKGKYTTGGDRRTQECPRYTQVGNAVPPLLSEAIGMMVAKLDKEYYC